ncbi:MAG: type II toxin-antitoxin system RelE/ParE family toxin [Nitrospirae bacterium]|nr:type II toxin-antitoxin system RelE/ParE family toxin [Nitrospirota bacterium]
MPYEIVFPSERVERDFEKTLEKLPVDYQSTIAEKVRSLSLNPRPEGKRSKKLKGEVVVAQFIAQYRLRVGPYRVLYDIDNQRKKVILLKLVKRDEHTYG